MSTKLSVHGYAYNRVFTYTQNNNHNEFTTPGGAALVAQLLSQIGLAETVPQDNSLRCEHVELSRFEDKKSKKDYYAISRRTGITEGKARFDVEGSASAASDAGAAAADVGAASDVGALATRYALLWGTDFDALPVPAGTPVLWATNCGLPNHEQFREVAGNCILLLDADVLRAAGAMISRQISWERTATELIWQMQNNPALSYLLKAAHILVTFAEDGAVHIYRDNGDIKADLALTHGGGEGTLRGKLQGEVDDAFLLMTVCLATQFTDITDGSKKLFVLPVLKSAEMLMLSGYSIDGLKNNDFPLYCTACGSGGSDGGALDESDVVFSVPVKPGQTVVDPDSWCISNNASGKRIFDAAFEYVMEGAKAIEKLPQFSFGALTTIDRWEIEAYQNIRNLILGYAADNSVRPLSIAVFGSPGSGKSFGVTQIAKNVLPDKIEKLEFNVSQFTGYADLGAAFQKVRDVILEGKLPLVFFDEFDSDRDGLPLGWIKSFLMPMQDGKFKDESGEHPLGKCILAFAGGTAASFEEFTKPMSKTAETQIKENFKNIKGPDFVSRLKGIINVLGPNPKDENDKNYVLRRALLLRSLCERKLKIKKGVAPVSKNIIWAMLLVPQYKHGARSMEAILDMSRLEGNVWEPVSLPFYSQLSLHVDADAFVKLVLREVILNSYTEQLAQNIHEDFCKKQTELGNVGAVYNIPWAQLPEGIKESNRDQARSISEKLKMIGYAYDSGDTPFTSVEAFDDETILLLAKNEHSRYVAERTADGWRYGEVRDDANKVHPLLTMWEELSAEEQQKDIDVAKNIIPLLGSIGLRVYKTI